MASGQSETQTQRGRSGQKGIGDSEYRALRNALTDSGSYRGRLSRNLPGETAELQDEYDKLKEKLSYWKGQVRRTERYTLREADTRKLTKSILDQYSSKADADGIGQRVKALGEYLMNGDEGGVRWVDAHDGAVRIARDIIQNASALVDDGERTGRRGMSAL